MKIIILIFITLLLLYLIKKESSTDYILPKIVWSHWDTDELPPLIEKIHNRNKRILKGWDVRLVKTSAFLKQCDPNELPKDFFDSSPAHKSDFIRLWLLKKHGGVWMDISTYLNESIDPMWEICMKEKRDLAGFYIESAQTNHKYRMFENWFIMAPKNSPVIHKWYNEYTKALDIGKLEFKKQLLSDGIDLQNMKHEDESVYFTQHYAFQGLLQRKEINNIIMWRAEDSMFLLQKQCWNIQDVEKCKKDLFNVYNIKKTPWIKLTGADRPFFSDTLIN